MKYLESFDSQYIYQARMVTHYLSMGDKFSHQKGFFVLHFADLKIVNILVHHLIKAARRIQMILSFFQKVFECSFLAIHAPKVVWLDLLTFE